MTLALTVNKSELLSELSTNCNKLTVGISWRSTTAAKPGLFNKLLGKTQAVDLDATCFLFDVTGHLIDRIWYKKMRSDDDSVRHQGDSLNGQDRGKIADLDMMVDQECIDIYLNKLSTKVHHLAFVINSFHGQSFNCIEKAACHISDDTGNRLINVNLSHSEASHCASLWLATISRDLDSFRITAMDVLLHNHQLEKIEQQIAQHLVMMFATHKG